MFSLIALLLIWYSLKIKPNVIIYLGMYGFALLIFSFAIDGNFLGLWDYMYVFDTVENSPLIVFYWFIFVLSYITFFIFISNKKISAHQSEVNIPNIRLVAYILAFLSVFATCYNVLGAGSPAMIISDSRAWELAFGRSVIFNYIYFLHLPALVLLGMIVGKRRANIFDFVLVVTLLTSSVFHGIKFTILHAFVFFVFSIYLVKGEVFSKSFYVLVFILTGLIVSFFIFGRGNGVYGALNYVVSASVNSMYRINNFSFYEISSLSILNPLSFLPVERIGPRLFSDELQLGSGEGFILNELYNLQHVITRAGFGIGSALIIYSFVFAIAINYLRLHAFNKYYRLFFLIMLINTLLFYFTAFEFYKTKLWFGFLSLFFIYYLTLFFKQIFFYSVKYRRRIV